MWDQMPMPVMAPKRKLKWVTTFLFLVLFGSLMKLDFGQGFCFAKAVLPLSVLGLTIGSIGLLMWRRRIVVSLPLCSEHFRHAYRLQRINRTTFSVFFPAVLLAFIALKVGGLWEVAAIAGGIAIVSMAIGLIHELRTPKFAGAAVKDGVVFVPAADSDYLEEFPEWDPETGSA